MVTLNNKDHYCGAWGDQAATTEYKRLISIWLANGRRIDGEDEDIAVAELGERWA